MIIIHFLLGGLCGMGIRYYCRHFALWIAHDVHASYCEIFSREMAFDARRAIIKPLKCGHFLWYFFLGGTLFSLYWLCLREITVSLYFAWLSALLYLIAKIDWHYRLIPPDLCQLVGIFGIIGSVFQFQPQSLEHAVQSLFIGFSVFWAVFYIARFIYRREAFGRGDYWLIGALSAFLPWQLLPLFIFTACISALIFTWVRHAIGKGINMIPFAPFLICAGISTFIWNVLG
ncbi:prepilin peptidase [Actinobacillus succinogenes]|uniref:Peptidase A24A prepilin type IV n=1 Tax=Actinobacillus succinogenes (strain ATCC 55618 / DSM 22257 / CCUG 43843 / 130Z) TaxID=339671 RepID=A6VLY7_ACTSZ|nr:A24 family peptidase [Actinobacillus succinogenes]ABR73984.1 peptidase A24A prepilin type IV [Actinobacillus succinogenes 130Z]PHI39575.1 prepilin peptidase [Actinobacillus succinogenes]